jgi:hypothetical protein
MMYDVVIISAIVVSMAGIIWATRKMDQAAKKGWIRYRGQIRIDNEPKRTSGVDKP